MKNPADPSPPASGIAVAGLTPADANQIYPAYPIWKGVMPWPPLSLMSSVGALTLENFVVVGDAWNQVLSRHLPRSGSQVLDIGCGCGRTARFLATNPHVRRYVGFDVVHESIAWCRRFIAPLTGGRFEFLHVDVYSAEYNRAGFIKASEFPFPVADRSTDLVFASSLFTHVLEPDAVHYLEETRRVLAPDGAAVLSIHIEATADRPYVGNETRIDIYPPYWRELAANAGLAVREHLGEMCGQDTYIFEPAR
jgi:SAM-dependent methyltransferase